MPRTSPYHLTLTDAERTELEGRARRYTSPYSDVVRAKIVLYAAQGLGNDEIAARLDTPRQVVSKWRKRFHEQRLPGLADQPQGGRPPPVFPPDVVVAVKALACELPTTAGAPLARWDCQDLARAAVEHAPRQGVRPLRADHRHRHLRPAGRPGHDHPALRHRASSVLGGRQRLLPPRTGQHRPAPASLAQTTPDPPARARVLAQSSGDLLLRRAT